MTYKISSGGGVPLNLLEKDENSRILQQIALLLSIRRGTVPGYREFGLPMSFVDMPPAAAEVTAYKEASEAFEEFGINARLNDLTLTAVGTDAFSADPFNKFILTAEVEI